MPKKKPVADAPLGIEAKLFKAADKLRSNMDAAEYKHVVLGLIFLKYVSDAFAERRTAIEADDPDLLEDRDEYTAENVFWVPKDARWNVLSADAHNATVGVTVDAAMRAVEDENPPLKGVLPKNYARPGLDKARLGELIDLVGGIGLGDEASRRGDVLGRVYEYFLSEFASAEGKKGGQFYTPRGVVRLLVEMLAPGEGRVYDPCCGSGGMFVQSESFLETHGGRVGDLAVYGQESNPTTRRLALMNLAIRGIDANLGPENADTFRRDLHPDLKADYVLANPPFNDGDWHRREDDVRWKYGVPPKGNANFAWVQHFMHHLAPGGTAGFVLANGSMSGKQGGEGDIRQKLVEADLVECMVALPGQLFYSTAIPVCLWFLTRDKSAASGGRDRRGETLFLDARRLGELVDRTHRELTDDELARLSGTYHAWRSGEGYEDAAGFCKSAATEEIAGHGFVLTPGRYVGAPEAEEDAEPFPEAMERLTGELAEQFAEGRRLEGQIADALAGVGFALTEAG